MRGYHAMRMGCREGRRRRNWKKETLPLERERERERERGGAGEGVGR